MKLATTVFLLLISLIRTEAANPTVDWGSEVRGIRVSVDFVVREGSKEEMPKAFFLLKVQNNTNEIALIKSMKGIGSLGVAEKIEGALQYAKLWAVPDISSGFIYMEVPPKGEYSEEIAVDFDKIAALKNRKVVGVVVARQFEKDKIKEFKIESNEIKLVSDALPGN